MQFYDSHASRLRLATPSTISILLGAASAAVAGVARLFQFIIDGITNPILIAPEMIAQASHLFHTGVIAFVTLSIVLFVLAAILILCRTNALGICHLVKQRLYLPENGNPLKLKDGERLPRVSCKAAENGQFVITVGTDASTVEDIQDIVDSISAGLKGKRFKHFAVTTVDVDVSHNYVLFTVEDVTLPREIIAASVDDLLSGDPTKLRVQDGAFIDLTTSGSMLVAGKTRSGKTTAIVSLLMQVLAYGRDKYGSKVTIIDPKRAELSQRPPVVTVDSDGEARSILNAVRDFADTITQRQAVLNDLSKQSGDAVK